MLTIGDTFPSFNLKSVVSGEKDKGFTQITNETYKGKWLVVFFWPKDFTFVCPTEIAEFGKANSKFADRDTQVLGASIDNEYVHLAWRNGHTDLNNLPFPMMSDVKRELSLELGILDKSAGVPLRATFIVNPDGIIQWVNVNNLDVGRNVDEVIRVLDALQTGELCQCGWTPDQLTLTAQGA